jgi:hypothetical protein
MSTHAHAAVGLNFTWTVLANSIGRSSRAVVREPQGEETSCLAIPVVISIAAENAHV